MFRSALSLQSRPPLAGLEVGGDRRREGVVLEKTKESPSYVNPLHALLSSEKWDEIWAFLAFKFKALDQTGAFH